MSKTILITGSTDGLGLETAKELYSKGHHVLLHGRNVTKLEKAKETLLSISSTGGSKVDTFSADLSKLAEVENLAKSVIEKYPNIDILINNAGIFSPGPDTEDGLDIRFAVNTYAPYVLTKRLISIIISNGGRIVNVASMSQSPVSHDALTNKAKPSEEYDGYCQCKLALISWTRFLASESDKKKDNVVIVAINPGSLLRTKMVTSLGVEDGQDISVGVDILCRAALSDEFTNASGLYYDNDNKKFADPHPDALDNKKCNEIVTLMEKVLNNKGYDMK